MKRKIISHNVGDHCRLKGKYRGAAHQNGNINVTQKHGNFIPFKFHNFSIYDLHLFFKKLVDKKEDKLNFDNIPMSNNEYISKTFGCIKFFDTYL